MAEASPKCTVKLREDDYKPPWHKRRLCLKDAAGATLLTLFVTSSPFLIYCLLFDNDRHLTQEIGRYYGFIAAILTVGYGGTAALINMGPPYCKGCRRLNFDWVLEDERKPVPEVVVTDFDRRRVLAYYAAFVDIFLEHGLGSERVALETGIPHPVVKKIFEEMSLEQAPFAPTYDTPREKVIHRYYGYGPLPAGLAVPNQLNDDSSALPKTP